MAKIGNIFFVLVMFLGFDSSAQNGSISAKATVDRNVMRPGDTLTFSITVESEGGLQVDSPILPDLTGFDVINRWSGSEVQSTFENGKFTTRRRLNYNYQLLARDAGKFTLGSAKVIAGGQEFLTKPIVIEVSGSAPALPPQAEEEQGGAPSDEDDIFEQLLRDRLDRYSGRSQERQRRSRQIPDLDVSEAFFIELEVDKKQVYVGEQVTASYYLVTRGQVSDIDTLQYPVLAGFWKEDIELATRLNFKPEVINGVQYSRALLASYALFPIKPGKASVDAYKAKCTIVSFNPFGMPGQKVLTRSSQNVDINVLPVPNEEKPTNFAGAVGDFTITSNLDKNVTKAGEPLSLKIRFEGRGNAKLIELPKSEFPSELEVYSSKNDSKFFKDGRSYKEFEYLLVPRREGAYQLPSLTVSLFNAEKKSYYALKSDSYSINVLPGDASDRIASEPRQSSGPSAPSAPKWPSPVFEFEVKQTFWPSVRNYVWTGLYGTSTFGFIVWMVLAFGWAKPRENLRRRTHVRLKEIRRKFRKSDYRSVGVDATNLLSQILGELSELGGGGHELHSLLRRAPPSFRNQYGEKLKSLMNIFESLAYAPPEAAKNLIETNNVGDLLNELEKILMLATELEFNSTESKQE